MTSTNPNSNIILAKRITQNNQEFLLGTFKIRQVRRFTKYTQHLIVSYEDIPDDEKVFADQLQIKPIYNPEIQRKTNPTKIERIADFLIYDPAAMFPTNIVISIPNQVIDLKEDEGDNVKIILNEIVEKELKKDDGNVYLTIIDGQHRIRGIERAIERLTSEIQNLSKVLATSTTGNDSLKRELASKSRLLERLMDFDLLVTFFIDPTLEYQAMIFATINKTQTKVPENLVYSLFGLTKDDSPQKTSLEVVLALNGIEKSPFYDRIKLVGGKYQRGEYAPLSQATMVKSILKNISNNDRESEIDRFKKRKELINNPKNLPFRKYYANDQDQKIVRIIYSFFKAVEEIFVDENNLSYWDLSSVDNVLHTNVGYQALLRILIDLLRTIPEDDRDKKEIYRQYLIKANAIDWKDSGEEKRYPYTSATVSVLYNDLYQKIFYN